MKSKSITRLQRRNVLILGKTGAGKSTLGNKLIEQSNILEGDLFKVSYTSVLSTSAIMETSVCTTLLMNESNHYIVQVVDTVGPFDARRIKIHGIVTNDMIMKRLSAFIKERVPSGFNTVLFVLKLGRWTVEEQETFDLIIRQFSDELSSISALVITGCETMTDKERANYATEFIKAQPAIAEFMQKGIHTIGFPNTNRVKPAFRKIFEDDAKSDQEYLRQLVYSCDEMKQVVKDEECKIS